MKKFFVLFCIPGATIDKWTSEVSEAERQEQSNKVMREWQEWMATHESAIVEKGAPLGKTKRVTADGIADARNDLNWYMVVEAESHEAAAEMFKGHPHLQIPTSYIEALDASRPGM